MWAGMTKTWGIVFAGVAMALSAGCDGSTSTTGTGGTSSSSTKSATGSTTATGSTSATGSTGATGSTSATGATGTGASTGSLMPGTCEPSGSNAGEAADCNALCAAILAAQCPGGPKDQAECLDACTQEFPACPMFDNFIDCGGQTATWSCSMTQSGVTPSKCAFEWGCMEAMCFGGGN